MKNQTQTKPRKKLLTKALKAFSLVELLVVIAVIGIIAAIAIPNISGITDAGKKAAAQRNAQNIVSVISSASSAGATLPGVGADVTAAVSATGITVTSGAFKDKVFQVPNVTGTTLTDAKEFIVETTSPPTYNPNATFTAN
jgi:type IV pilus assembly protein PilA